MKKTVFIIFIVLLLILGLRLVSPDDPSFPFKLEADFSPPEFMGIAFVLMHGGSEEIIVRSMTREALDKFVEMNSLGTHPRLRRMTITRPDGNVEEIKGRMG